MSGGTMYYQNKGFTLIELTVVLIIMVTGFGVIATSISSGNKSAQLKAVTRDLGSAFRYARGQALISRKEVAVAIDLSKNTYKITSRDKVFHFSSEIDVTLVIAQDEFKDDEIGQIRFYADGSSSGGRVTMEWGNLKRIIDINWLTGKVESRDE